MPRDRPDLPIETLEERWLLQEQTARNLEGLSAEQEGRLNDAVALYERNAQEGFSGDWPYGRLVAIYEKGGHFAEAERVLLRAIEVIGASGRRTPQDRRTTVASFRRRLDVVRKKRKDARRPSARALPSAGTTKPDA